MDYPNHRASYALSAQSSAQTVPGTNPYAKHPGVVPNLPTHAASDLPSTIPATSINFVTAFQQSSTQEVDVEDNTSRRTVSRPYEPKQPSEPDDVAMSNFIPQQIQEEPDFENSDCCNFVIGFVFSLLLSSGVFLFLCCAPTLGIRGRKVRSFLWGAGVGNLLILGAAVTGYVFLFHGVLQGYYYM